MKNVFVCHAKEDKSITKKLVSKLESAGIKCFVTDRDKASGNEEELISKTQIFVLILSENSQKSNEVSEQIKKAVEHNAHIIPFKVSKIENTMTMQYFLHSLEWVDAFGDGFDEAYEVLTEIMEEISAGKIVKKTPKNYHTGNKQDFSIQKLHLYIVISILSLIIIYLLFIKENKSSSFISDNQLTQTGKQTEVPEFVNSEINEDEKILIGAWKMTDYEDSRAMSPEERKITEQNVEQMKKQVLLTFGSNRSFTRAGFRPNLEKGFWEYDSKKHKIYLTPEKVNKKEEINILSLTEKEMIFVVTELIPDKTGKRETVTTKITFNKK